MLNKKHLNTLPTSHIFHTHTTLTQNEAANNITQPVLISVDNFLHWLYSVYHNPSPLRKLTQQFN